MSCSYESQRCWKIDEWPAADQVLWMQNLAPLAPLEDPRYGPHLGGASLQKARKGYGRWLCFLAAQGWLDPDATALARVTERRLNAYYKSLLQDGNRDYTVIGRASELKMALKILSQAEDVTWVQRPYGHTVYARLEKQKRDIIVPSSSALFAWGLDLMDDSQRREPDRTTICAYRDGLLIAMLAARARRLRSMALLRVNHEIYLNNGVYVISLTGAQVKTKKPDRFSLPKRLSPYIDQYLGEVRPKLLSGNVIDQLWVNTRGEPLTEKAVQYRVLYHSLKKFGVAFGPHRFRHAIATTAALGAPECPGLAAGLLGISKGVVEENYNRAGQVEAALEFDRLLYSQEKQTEPEVAQSVVSDFDSIHNSLVEP